MFPWMSQRYRAQRGFSLPELLIAVAVFSLLAYSAALSRRNDAVIARGETFATSFSPYDKALETYVVNNRVALQAGTAIAGIANPLSPTAAELQAVTALAATYPVLLPDTGGAPVFRVGRLPGGCLGSTCDIEYYVGTTTPLLNGDGTAAEGVLSYATRKLGGTAGYSDSITPTVIAGRGGWNYTNPQVGIAGIFATYKTYSASAMSTYVTIGDTRNPNLAGALTVAGATTVGGATTLNGATQVNNTLNVTGATTMAAAASVGTTLAVAGATTLTGATQINNSVTATGSASANRFVPTGTFALGAACTDDGAFAKATTGGAVMCSGGTWRQMFLGSTAGTACATNGTEATDASSVKLTCVNGTFRAWSTLITAGTVGAVCTVDGQPGWDFTTASPTQLLCRANPSGGGTKWYRLQDITTNLVFVTAYEVTNVAPSNTVAKPTCNVAGGQTVTSLLQLIPKTETSTDSGFTRYATDNGASWTVHLTDTAGNGLGVAIGQVFCYYN